MEGPEHLLPPLAPSCASWLFGEWFWKGHPSLILQGVLPRGAVTKPSEVLSPQLAGPPSPPKPGRGSPFLGHYLPCQVHVPTGGISVQPHNPHSPSLECVSCTHPTAAPPPRGVCAPASKRGEDTLTQQVTALILT